MSSFYLDQLVWVKTGDKHEEPGKVVRLGCDLVQEGQVAHKVPVASSITDKGQHGSLGIEVLMHMSGKKGIFDISVVRPLDDNTNKNGGRSTRRKQENKTAHAVLVSPSPATLTSCSTGSSLQGSAVNDEEGSHEEEIETSQKRRAKPTSSCSVLDSDKKEKAKKKITELAKKDGAAKRYLSEEEDRSSSVYLKKRKVNSQISESEADPILEQAVKSRRKKSNTAVATPKVSKSIKDARKRAPALIVIEDSSASSGTEDSEEGDVDDDDDPFDRPYTVERASSGRATCRTCDEIICKDSLRISHVPLFRGKPGYRVYRHLQCAIFSEEIKTAQDVGGWRKLKKNDLKALEERVEESKRLVMKENEELEPDELVQTEFQGEIRKAPAGLANANLLPFQVEGFSWMYHQEYHIEEIRGGILADEMGMGKTLQTIVTLLDNRPILQHSKPDTKHPPSSPDIESRKREESLWAKAVREWKHEMEMIGVSKKLLPRKGAARAGTLVVCPLIALSQWKSEIEKFTETGALSVSIYHGPNRTSDMPLEMLTKYDVVLTTYQVLEQDYRKMVSPNKVTCPNCNAKFKIDKLRIHLKYFCGATAQRTEAQARQRRGNDRQSTGQAKGKGNKQNITKTSKGKEAEDDNIQANRSSNKKGRGRVLVVKKGSGRKDLVKQFSRAKKKDDYDSESELSVDNDVLASMPSCRPCRSAATTASKKVAAAFTEWRKDRHKRRGNGSSDSSDSSFGEESDDDDSISDSNEHTSVSEKKISSKAPQKKVPCKELENARRKQEMALKNAKNSSKHLKKKVAPVNKKNFSDSEVDPLEGIDLDDLMDEAMAGSKRSLLHSLCWWRVVLDEAHFIKSRSSQTAASAFALTSVHRWCLSGTPLQNRVGELYSLIRFLRIDPMAYYICRMKGCCCKSIHYRMQHGICQGCGHRSFMHYAHFNKHVLTPIQRDGYAGDGRRAMFTLKNEVLDKSLLRRTKETRAADMELPPRLVTIRAVRLHPIEEDFYQSLYMETKASFDDYVQAGTLMNNYAHIFDLLTKMRQATNHPYMVVYTKKNANKYLGNKPVVANGSVDCDMCHESPTDRILSSCCSSAFCRSCVLEYLAGAGGGNTACPSCRAPFTIDLNQEASEDLVDDGNLTLFAKDSSSLSGSSMPSLKELSNVATGSILRRINLAEFATSSKIEVLVQELIEMRKKRPGSKALVFSQFVNMLDLVRWRLHSDPCLADLGLGVRILHGGMNAKSRDEALKVFREDNSCRVLLMSLKAAGVALNLTVASECFLLDLWWNPAAEMQAIDRTHRLGQYRPIRAVRFVAEGTVEERVLQLQEKKRLVFDGTVGRDAGSLKLLTEDDMKSLFA